ncbi:MAG: hypothetical protein HY909_28835 [Deltaproteobacteria bacterium]|nr:hypothetical protein [Deltaproteobacteria bacterium]
MLRRVLLALAFLGCEREGTPTDGGGAADTPQEATAAGDAASDTLVLGDVPLPREGWIFVPEGEVPTGCEG